MLCDLDGVVWRGENAIEGSAEAIEQLRDSGLTVAFLTNNSSTTPDDYVARLAAVGVSARRDEVLTSATVAADLIVSELGSHVRAMACAGQGVVEALREVGIAVADDGPVDVVVVGWHRDFDFDGLTRAARAIRAGARFVATNLDPTFPAPEGFLPGNGSLVAAVRTASGVDPIVAGKPEPATATFVRTRFGAEGVMIGDRPSTDGAMAGALGWPFALVLSGVAGAGGEEPVPDPPPAYVADDLAALAPMLCADWAP